MGNQAVIYPDIPQAAGYFEVQLDGETITELILGFRMMAEEMPMLNLYMKVDFSSEGEPATVTPFDQEHIRGK